MLHTSLDVRFDKEKKLVFGEANLTLKPYGYPQDRLVLDAQDFDLHEVSMDDSRQQLEFRYDSQQI